MPGDRACKIHLDGYDQTAMLTGKCPSQRHVIWYFGESQLGAPALAPSRCALYVVG